MPFVVTFQPRPAVRRLPRWVGLVAATLLLAGCCTPRAKPPAPPRQATANPQAARDYAVVFPDVVELTVAGRPDCPTLVLVNPDGCIDLGPYGTVFAEGATAGDLAARVAFATGTDTDQVNCQVAAARSRVVYLLGDGAGRPRALPYAGPEHVSEVIRRAGGLPAGADPSAVRVVRRNVARGTPAETFRVDLSAVRRGDARTDLVVEPNDEVHVAEDHGGVMLAAFVPGLGRP